VTRTDAELLTAARDDPAAFRELYDRYVQRVHGFHLRRTRDHDAAHDLTAETFAQARSPGRASVTWPGARPISGGKAIAAVFTGGVSMLALGLPVEKTSSLPLGSCRSCTSVRLSQPERPQRDRCPAQGFLGQIQTTPAVG